MGRKASDLGECRAYQKLAELMKFMVAQILDQGCDPNKVDVVAEMRKSLESTRKNVKNAMGKAEKLRDSFKGIAARFKTKAEDNVLKAAAESAVLGIDRDLENGMKELSVLERADVLLKEYSYNVEQGKAYTQLMPMLGTFTWR